jgi:hypothetical protein
MIKVLALICRLASPTDCMEQIVTNSDVTDLTMAACVVGAPQVADWILKNHPGYRLAKWTCTMGTRDERGA